MNLDEVRVRSALLQALTKTELTFFESVATPVRVSSGDVLFEEAGPADEFFVVLDGRIGLELTSPGREPMIIQTLGSGDLVGLSWLFPPYRWNWKAVALANSELAAFDAVAIRAEIGKNRDLALEVVTVVGREVARRLQQTRVQLLDLYRKDPR